MTPPNLDDIESALYSGLSAATALKATCRPNSDAYEIVEGYWTNCVRGIESFKLLRQQLRDGQRHIEPPAEREAPRVCECNATSHPPCSFCESGAGATEDAAQLPEDPLRVRVITEAEFDDHMHRRQIGDPRL